MPMLYDDPELYDALLPASTAQLNGYQSLREPTQVMFSRSLAAAVS